MQGGALITWAGLITTLAAFPVRNQFEDQIPVTPLVPEIPQNHSHQFDIERNTPLETSTARSSLNIHKRAAMPAIPAAAWFDYPDDAAQRITEVYAYIGESALPDVTFLWAKYIKLATLLVFICALVAMLANLVFTINMLT